jgi:hypothetical protein
VLNDLEAVLGAYDRYLAKDQWRDAVDLCSTVLGDRKWFEEQEIEYKLRIARAAGKGCRWTPAHSSPP